MWALVLALVLVAGVGAYIYLSGIKAAKDKQDASSKSLASLGPVPMEDFVRMFNRLGPDATHMDILWAVISMNSILERATEEIEKIDDLREKREKQLADEAKSKKGGVDFDDLVNAGGWGDDDDAEGDEDGEASDAVRKAKEEEKKKEDERARFRKATGKTLPPMEGLDKGVIGQEWVMRVLGENDAWPPKLGAMADETFVYKQTKNGRTLTKKLKPMDHPAFRRCLCMTMGRINSSKLNGHPELIEAGLKKLADETYFKGSLEFRQRIALILEASIRIAHSLHCFPLFATLVEMLAAFKIGCDPNDAKSLPFFNGQMARQYNTLPRLEIGELFFEKPRKDNNNNKANDKEEAKEPEQPERMTDLVAGQPAVVVIPVDRKHAEAFTKVKIEQCKKQGIPPQVALQGYREAWWFLVRWQATSKDTENAVEDIPPKFIDQLDKSVADKLKQSSPDQRVRTAFPMMVQNIAQKTGAVKVRITAPENPGKYKIFVAVKSQDFLGADQELSIDTNVLEPSEEEPSTTQDASEDAEKKKEK